MIRNLGFLGFSNFAVTSTGEVFNIQTLRRMKPYVSGYGYSYVTITQNKVRKQFFVHKLVATAFIPNTENKPQVNHLDGDKQNNMVGNLEWATQAENTQHAYDSNLINRDGLGYQASPENIELAHSICKMLEDGFRSCDIASATGARIGYITSIRNKKILKHVSNQYDLTKVKKQQQIDISKIYKICELLSTTSLSARAISREVKCSPATVNAVRDRRIYTYISCGYHW